MLRTIRLLRLLLAKFTLEPPLTLSVSFLYTVCFQGVQHCPCRSKGASQEKGHAERSLFLQLGHLGRR